MAQGWSSVEGSGFSHQCQKFLEGKEEKLKFSEWPRAPCEAVLRKVQGGRRKEREVLSCSLGPPELTSGRESKTWCFRQVLGDGRGLLSTLNWPLLTVKVATNAGREARNTPSTHEPHQLVPAANSPSFVTVYSFCSLRTTHCQWSHKQCFLGEVLGRYMSSG